MALIVHLQRQCKYCTAPLDTPVRRFKKMEKLHLSAIIVTVYILCCMKV